MNQSDEGDRVADTDDVADGGRPEADDSDRPRMFGHWRWGGGWLGRPPQERKPLSDISLWMFVVLPASAVLFALLKTLAIGLLVTAFSFALLECGRRRESRLPTAVARYLFFAVVGIVVYALGGHAWMYGPEDVTGIFNSKNAYDPAISEFRFLMDLMFQASMAANCALIFAGCLGGRLRGTTMPMLVALIAGVVYPVFGGWHWGGGWLNEMGFRDFSGGCAIAAVAGWSALGVIVGMHLAGCRPAALGESLDRSARRWIYLAGALLWPATLVLGMLSGDPDVLIVGVGTLLAAGAGGLAAFLLGLLGLRRLRIHLVFAGWLAGYAALLGSADVLSNMSSLQVGVKSAALLIAVLYIANRFQWRGDVVFALAFALGGSEGVRSVASLGQFGLPAYPQYVGIVAAAVWAFGFFFAFTWLTAKVRPQMYALPVGALSDSSSFDNAEPS